MQLWEGFGPQLTKPSAADAPLQLPGTPRNLGEGPGLHLAKTGSRPGHPELR